MNSSNKKPEFTSYQQEILAEIKQAISCLQGYAPNLYNKEELTKFSDSLTDYWKRAETNVSSLEKQPEKWVQIDALAGVYAKDKEVIVEAELIAQKEKLLSEGVKTEPDAETLEVYNRVNAHEQQKLWLDSIDEKLAGINAAKEME